MTPQKPRTLKVKDDVGFNPDPPHKSLLLYKQGEATKRPLPRKRTRKAAK